MFKTKYTTTLLDSKWSVIKNGVIFKVIPRKDEYIYINDMYYQVLNVVHNLTIKHQILIIVEEYSQKNVMESINNQSVIK
jgi:hypothetical protein